MAAEPHPGGCYTVRLLNFTHCENMNSTI
uniref:Uncharacterized protein n=1 Tax=Anguilla anguilla TaxID=7936 RepID=A0A0E9PHB4_ANGAN